MAPLEASFHMPCDLKPRLVLHLHSKALNNALLNCLTFVGYGWAILAIDLALYFLVRRVHARVLGALNEVGELEGLSHASDAYPPPI